MADHLAFHSIIRYILDTDCGQKAIIEIEELKEQI